LKVKKVYGAYREVIVIGNEKDVGKRKKRSNKESE
jgi:hypothetical protein